MAKQYYDENGNPVDVEKEGTTKDGKEVVYVEKKKNGGCLKWGLLILAILLLVGACAAIFGSDDDTSTDTQEQTEQTEQVQENSQESESVEEGEEVEEAPEQAIDVTATELIDTYQNNELQGAEQFEGNAVNVTGVVSDISSSGSDVQVRMEGDTDENFLYGVVFNFEQDSQEGLSEINSGDRVTINGVVRGLDIFDDVEVMESTVVQQ